MRRVEDIPSALAAAHAATRGPRCRRAAVEIPIDFLDAETAFEIPDGPAQPVVLTPDSRAVDETAELLLSAQRPILYAGGGVISAEASAELVALAEALEAPVLTSTSGKGAIDELHALALGCTWGLSSVPRSGGMHFELVARADAALALGTRFTAMSSGRWAMPFPEALVHVDVDAEELGRNYRPRLAVQADARAMLTALLDAIGSRRSASQWSREELTAYKSRWRDEAQAGSAETLAFVDALRAVIPTDGILSNDQAMLNYWCARFYPARGPRTFFYPIGSATLGFGAPAAFGAKAARPDAAVVALAGDGGFLFTGQELAAAVQARLAVPIIVLNDNAYGMIRTAQQRRYGERRLGVDLHNPDFVRFGEAFGARAARVDTPQALGRAVSDALAADVPTIIEIPATLPPPVG